MEEGDIVILGGRAERRSLTYKLKVGETVIRRDYKCHIMVIEKEVPSRIGVEFVIEDIETAIGGLEQGGGCYSNKEVYKARKLSKDRKYNPHGPLVKFTIGDGERGDNIDHSRIQIVGKLEKTFS